MRSPSAEQFAVSQIGIVVADLESTMKAFYSTLGWGPWTVYDLESPDHHDIQLQGRDGDFGVRVAICRIGEIAVELIEPLYGDGPQSDFLKQKGGGVHHILVSHKSSGTQAQLQQLNEDIGLPIMAEGSICNKVRYAYMDGSNALGTIVETAVGSLSERDRLGLPNFRIYPDPEAPQRL